MKLLIVFLAFAVSCSAWAGLSSCENELLMNGPTKNLVSYFSILLERHIVTREGLRAFRDALSKGSLTNPIPKNETSSALLIHRAKLEKLLESGELEIEPLREWASRALHENDREAAQREEAAKQTLDPFEKPVFVPVPEGSMVRRYTDWNNTPNYRDITLRIPSFEVMRTHVTQKMWAETMGENPSQFKTGLDGRVFEINGKPIAMRPDNPVENMTWYSALVFANKFSIQHGLKPAYDLSGLTFKGDMESEAAKGTLVATAGRLRIHVPEGGTVYETEGYRLPMEVEADYLLTDFGRHQKNFIHFESKSKGIEGSPNLAALAKHAWFSQNSFSEGPENGTHPVAQLDPYVLETPDGPIELFDLQGNVDLWTVKMEYVRNDSTDTNLDAFQHLKGGSWIGDGYDLINPAKMPQATHHGVYSTGLRLVRSLKK